MFPPRFTGFVFLFMSISCFWVPILATVVEFDLVFPRNGTYAPGPLFPIVFAVQNPQFLGALAPDIEWSIWSNATERLISHFFRFSPAVDVTTEPYFLVLNTNMFNDTEGLFAVIWGLRTTNCSTSNPSNYPSFDTNLLNGNTAFTIQRGAQQPNVITTPDSCPSAMSAFNITDTLPYVPPNDLHSFGSCGVLALPGPTPTPTPTPCAVQVNQAIASSISSKITASYLSACNTTIYAWHSGCPVPTSSPKATNIASNLKLAGSWMTGLGIGFLLI